MDKDDLDCQSGPVWSVGDQVEEVVVYSPEEGIDFAAKGTVSDSEQVEKEAVKQGIDTGTPLGCRDRKKKPMYP